MTPPRGTLAGELRAAIECLRPDLRGVLAPTVRGRVVASHPSEYAVDVEVGDDPALMLPKVPVAAVFAQAGYGVFALPEPGAGVLVAFEEGDLTRPVVQAPAWLDGASPSYPVGTLALKGKQGQEIILDAQANRVTIQAAEILLGSAGSAGQPAPKGNPLHSALSTILSVLKSTPLGLSTSPGSPITPNPAVAGALGPADTALAQLLSSKVNIE